jgi:methylmalonyl-CoA/ethylmalonyl-CoA epimerase
MPAASTTISNIGQIAMPVRDLSRAIEFYRDRLGLPLLFQAPPGLAFFQCGSIRLLVEVPAEKEFQHPGSPLYFTVADIGAGYEELRARGVVFRGEPHLIARMPDHELWMAFFDDGEGNTHALMCEKRS